MNRQNAEKLLQQAINKPFAEFREGQWEAIDAVVNQRKKCWLFNEQAGGKVLFILSARGYCVTMGLAQH